MRGVWNGLTLRGRAVLLSGILTALAAVLLGQHDLVRVAALLVALPLVATLLLARRDDRVSVTRDLEPRQVPVGGLATVRLQLRGEGSRTGGPLLLTDELDPSLGIAPRVVALRVAPGRTVDASYQVDARSRGRHAIGPLTLTLEDPFGLVQQRRTTEARHTLIVTPSIAALSGLPDVRAAGGLGDGGARRTAVAGHDDIGTREYRSGDELRRVHWRATARTGDLMVRQEEQPWEAEATVVLDTRRQRHSGPATTDDPLASSFEWSVHLAASVVEHLANAGRRVRLLAGGNEVTVAGGSTATILDALAVVRTGNEAPLVPAGSGSNGQPLVVAVLAGLDAADLGTLSGLRASAAAGLAIVLDTGSWARPPAPPADAAALVAPLRAAGWRTTVARAGEDAAEVWSRVLR